MFKLFTLLLIGKLPTSGGWQHSDGLLTGIRLATKTNLVGTEFILTSSSLRNVKLQFQLLPSVG